MTKNGCFTRHLRLAVWLWSWLCTQLAFLALYPGSSRGADSLCASVKIEIAQELTLERQAFDARMKINNGLDTIALENVGVTVQFADDDGNPVLATSDPNDTSALFFIRLDSMDGISDVSGAGTVAPASAAEIHWLIIPAAGAAGNQPQGKRYQVGATLRYGLGGEQKDVEVAPDTITVTPQPRLVLDYFLTKDVFADDPFTAQIEPPEPFTLGVRVKNNGFGAARRVAIDSAQPRIVENSLGLLIGFSLTGSSIDDQPAAPTLRISFGDIDAQRSRAGRWVMETTLSGRFTEFSATFSHADELGGRLTSLIDAVSTHFLVHDVRVDLPGRDGVRDFLALDGNTLHLYESDSADTLVTDLSGVSMLTPLGGDRYTLSMPLTAGPLYVSLADPSAGTKTVRSVVRSDGKVLPSENGWTSKTGNGNSGFQHFVNVFDVNGGGTYAVQMGSIVVGPMPPVIQFVPDRTTIETQRISFLVEATDPNGTVPALSVAALPVGASFLDRGDGVGIFDWTPTQGQAGSYPITYRASDGALPAARTAVINVQPFNGTVMPTTPPATPTTPIPPVTPSDTPTISRTNTPTDTPTVTPTPTPLCGATPRGDCRAPHRAELHLKMPPDPRKRVLRWKWLFGEATQAADLGDPRSGTRYALCIYDPTSLLYDAEIQPGGICRRSPCWKALGGRTPEGFRYEDRRADDQGMERIIIRAGGQGRARARVRGQGDQLQSVMLPLALPVTTQLVNSEGQCWSTTHSTAPLRNSATEFLAQDR